MSDPTFLVAAIGFACIALGVVTVGIGIAEDAMSLWLPAIFVLALGLVFAFAPEYVVEAVTAPAHGKLTGLG